MKYFFRGTIIAAILTTAILMTFSLTETAFASEGAGGGCGTHRCSDGSSGSGDSAGGNGFGGHDGAINGGGGSGSLHCGSGSGQKVAGGSSCTN